MSTPSAKERNRQAQRISVITALPIVWDDNEKVFRLNSGSAIPLGYTYDKALSHAKRLRETGNY